MNDITEFLGKPVEYWQELDSCSKENLADEILMDKMVLEYKNKKLIDVLNKIANPQYTGTIGGDIALLNKFVTLAQLVLIEVNNDK